MRLWTTIVLAATLAGCSSPKPRPATEWTVFLSNESRYSEVIVSADGRDLAPDSRRGGFTYFTVPLRTRPDGTAIEPSFRARVQTPCGWREADLDVRRAPDGSGTTVNLTLYAGPRTENAGLWVDNRRRPEARLRVNGEERVIAADQATHFQLTYELCPAAREVSLDGKVVGMLPEKVPEPKGGGLDYNNPLDVHYFFLLDTSGKGCYVYTEYCYAKKGSSEVCSGPQTRTYRGNHLHPIPREINFFFEAAPKKTQVATPYYTATQVSLNDCGAR